MILLVHTAHPQALAHAGPGFGRLLSPRNALDSWLFLTLAFGSLAFFWGNFVGKAEMILVGAALTATRRRLLPVRSAT